MEKKEEQTFMKINTNFDNISKEIYEFEKLAGFSQTSEKRLIEALKNEIKEYEEFKSNLSKRNKLMDIIILSIQISRRRNMSLDDAWKNWWKKSRKYLGKNKDKYKKNFDNFKRN